MDGRENRIGFRRVMRRKESETVKTVTELKKRTTKEEVVEYDRGTVWEIGPNGDVGRRTPNRRDKGEGGDDEYNFPIVRLIRARVLYRFEKNHAYRPK